MNGQREERPISKDEGTEPARAIRRLNVSDLFAGDRELVLVHNRAEYRLRVTNNDKLILTK